jgi:hypothetical protein
MSPDGRFIGFAVPANCRQTCTLDWFNTRTLKTHFGPTGVSNETAFGWMKDGRSLFAVLNRQLTVLNATSGNAVSYTLPSNLPPRLFHVFRGVSTGSKTVVYDTATGARYVGNMAVSH